MDRGPSTERQTVADRLRVRAPVIGTAVAAQWHQRYASPGSSSRATEICHMAESATLSVAESLAQALLLGDDGSLTPPVEAGLPEVGAACWDLPGMADACLLWRSAMAAEFTDDLGCFGDDGPAERQARELVEGVADALVRRATTHLELVRRRLETQLVRQQSRLEHAALHDPLTGLANRALVVDRLRHALRAARRRSSRPGVVVLNLDHFKSVNDVSGHTFGDQLLVAVGARMRTLVRPGDTVARPGGDEFVIVCDDLADPADEIRLIAKRVLDGFATPFEIAGQEYYVCASLGIAYAEADEDAERVLEMADHAMYRAKQSGRGRIVRYDPSVDREAARRSQIISGLQRAIERDELRLVYQPIFGAGGPWLLGREALLRWRHPVLGDVGPDEFIPVAEHIGGIAELGRWVLARACEDCAQWQAAGERHVGVSVNVSGCQFDDGRLGEHVESALREAALHPSSLTLEITESQLVADRPGTVEVLERLRAVGVRVAVDDFGTGYSSLSWLARLPIDVIKIDRSFVVALRQAGRESTIVQTMIRLAHTLGLSVVAEGVETDEQLAHLVRLGCDLAQGYLLGRPEPLARSEHAA